MFIRMLVEFTEPSYGNFRVVNLKRLYLLCSFLYLVLVSCLLLFLVIFLYEVWLNLTLRKTHFPPLGQILTSFYMTRLFFFSF